MLDVALAEFMAAAHRTRRIWIPGAPIAMLTGVAVMLARNWDALARLGRLLSPH